jgi:hypothetical protein
MLTLAKQLPEFLNCKSKKVLQNELKFQYEKDLELRNILDNKVSYCHTPSLMEI